MRDGYLLVFVKVVRAKHDRHTKIIPGEGGHVILVVYISGMSSHDPNVVSDIPYRWDKSHSVNDLVANYGYLEAGQHTTMHVSVAGRLMRRRDQGKIVFGTLRDQTGDIQLFAPAAVTPFHANFKQISIGDWIGVQGQIMTTKRGELSIKVLGWSMLAETEATFPDKWHGITDPDARYRQRYLELWSNPDSRETFRKRSQILMSLRRVLHEQDFVEVETPVLHPIPGGATAKPFITHHEAMNADMYLRIAPELYLKRLVVGGMERVFEIGRVFRNEGISTRHNPEFTELELYWAYSDYHDMMNLTESLIEDVAIEVCGSSSVLQDGVEIDLSTPWRRATMDELITEHVGIEANVDTPRSELQAYAREVGVSVDKSWGSGKILTEIYEKVVEPRIEQPTFVIDYPVEVSPLARRHRTREGYTERFEVVVDGKELCNAFTELVDAAEQRERFEKQAQLREEGDDEAMTVDEDYLKALDHGMPPTAGLGIGIDRLVMLLTGNTSIRDTVLFPTLRSLRDE